MKDEHLNLFGIVTYDVIYNIIHADYPKAICQSSIRCWPKTIARNCDMQLKLRYIIYSRTDTFYNVFNHLWFGVLEYENHMHMIKLYMRYTRIKQYIYMHSL